MALLVCHHAKDVGMRDVGMTTVQAATQVNQDPIAAPQTFS
jgi:hypothetical protein